MKPISIMLIMLAGWVAGCQNDPVKPGVASPVANTIKDTAAPANLKETSPQFSNLDPSIRAALITAANNYMALKDALANNDENEARSQGKNMVIALSGIDKTHFTADQRKIYEAEEQELMEDAEHIGKSKIAHQRMHFSVLSQRLYNVLISFNTGRPYFVVYCDSAEHQDPAMWLSETIDHKNPYMANAKTECYSVGEKIK